MVGSGPPWGDHRAERPAAEPAELVLRRGARVRHALALLRHPDLFKVAVAGAPVTDWRNYDTIYTERYMRTPDANRENYDASSCVELAGNLEGELLLLHGMVDDNVHPSNSWQLVNRLQGLDRPFEMLFFPNSAHGIWSPASRSAKWSFLVERLVPEGSGT